MRKQETYPCNYNRSKGVVTMFDNKSLLSKLTLKHMYLLASNSLKDIKFPIVFFINDTNKI